MSTQPKGTALITGAGKRIGRTLALHLGKAGYGVGVHYRSSEKDAQDVAAEIVRNGGKAACVRADLSKENETAALIENARTALGAPVSLLINNASVFENDDLDTMTRKSWDQHIETNLRAPLKLAQDFAQQNESLDNPLIINIIDQRVLKPTPQFLSYSTSKGALFNLTTTLAQALGPRGIRVNGIGPGPILQNARQSEEDWRKQNEATILGHGATPDDIAHTVDYFIKASAVTGQMIAVDGGQHLAWQTPDVMVNE